MPRWKVDHLWIFTADDELVEVLGTAPEACPFFDATLTETINGVDKLEFSIPAEHPRASKVIRGQVAVFAMPDGGYRAFRIQTQWQTLNEDGTRVRRFYCEDIAIDELHAAPVIERRPSSPFVALENALENSLWEVGQVDSGFPEASTHFYHESAMSCIRKITETWGGEIRFRITHDGKRITGRFVDFLLRRGKDTGRRIVAGKDMRSIVSMDDVTGVCTALYGYGKGEQLESGGYSRRISFADVEWSIENGDPVDKPKGQEWVGDPEALAAWGLRGGTVHRFDFAVFEDEEDPEELLRLTWEELQYRKAPQVSYNVSIVDLEAAAGYEHEAVRIGDSVTVVDDDMSPPLEFKARIVEIKRYLNEPERTELTIGQIQSTMTESVNRVGREMDNVVKVGDPLGYLNTAFQTLTDDLNRTPGYVYISPTDGITITDKPKDQNPTSAIRFKGGMLAIANEWDPATGDFKWQTFGTGDGFFANLIVAGTMLADRIRGGTLALGGWNNENGQFVVYDEEGELIANLDAGIGGFDRLYIGDVISDSVVKRLTEDVNYYVDPLNGSDENDGLTPETPLRSLQRAVDLCPHELFDAYCRIYVIGDAEEFAEYLYIRNFKGGGNLEFYFPENKSMTMQGAILVEDCYTRIKFYNAVINYRDTEQLGVIRLLNSSLIEFYNCVTYGGSTGEGTGASYGVHSAASNAIIYDCEFYDSWRACVFASNGSSINISNCKGQAQYGLWASRNAHIGGDREATAPAGTVSNTRTTGGGICYDWSDSPLPQPFDPGSAAPPPPPATGTKTKTWTSVGGASWRDRLGGWRNDNNYVYQGEWGSNGLHRGYWIFPADLWNTLQGKQIKRIRFYCSRLNRGGQAAPVTVDFYNHRYTSVANAKADNDPKRYGSPEDVTFRWGQSRWFDLPSSWFADFASGTAKGVCIYTSSRSNSRYAIFDPKAKIEVTYV